MNFSPNFLKLKIQNLAIYSDIVAHSVRFGDKMTNLLSLITVDSQNQFSRNHTQIMYKPLRYPYFNSICMSLHDSEGTPICFEEGSISTFELEIKPVSS